MWRKNKPYLLILPALIVTIVLFFGGILQGFFQSIGLTPIVGVSHFSVDFYKKTFKSKEFWDSFFLTLRISTLSTIIAGFVGMFIIFCLYLLRSRKSNSNTLFFERVFQLPMLFPYLVAGYLMFLMFTQSGWVSRIMFNLGYINNITDFPIIVNEKFGWGIIITYVWKTSAFVVLMLYPVILQVQSSWMEVGRIFGANRFSFYKEVVIPLLIEPWKTACFIIFAYTFFDFEVPFLLGVTYPKTLSVYSYQMYMNGELIDRPRALAINIIILIIVAFVGVIFSSFSKKNRTQKRGK